jgi:hypothetical protein
MTTVWLADRMVLTIVDGVLMTTAPVWKAHHLVPEMEVVAIGYGPISVKVTISFHVYNIRNSHSDLFNVCS